MSITNIRFGYGLGPNAPAQTPQEALAALSRPDRVAEVYAAVPIDEVRQLGRVMRQAVLDQRAGDETAAEIEQTHRTQLREILRQSSQKRLARILDTDCPLRERLVAFWLDHFTVIPVSLVERASYLDYADRAIRPHVTAPFSQMMKAVVRHPSMLIYLDQFRSVGPTSRMGQRTGQGLNENLARELLELHSLGAAGGYSQADVRATAELLTGLMVHPIDGFQFLPQRSEPGMVTILGQRYGRPGPGRIEDIDEFLDDLALHPATARYVSEKLAVHFVSSDPPVSLIEDLEARYLETDGDLGAVTERLVEHPEAQLAPLRKVKWPIEYIASGAVAFGLSGAEIMALGPRDQNRYLRWPMSFMGQPEGRPGGPDGWSEDQAHWITPQSLAARLNWATLMAAQMKDRVGDPRAILTETLGAFASDALRFAVGAAETREEGLALILASAEFNRR